MYKESEKALRSMWGEMDQYQFFNQHFFIREELLDSLLSITSGIRLYNQPSTFVILWAIFLFIYNITLKYHISKHREILTSSCFKMTKINVNISCFPEMQILY